MPICWIVAGMGGLFDHPHVYMPGNDAEPWSRAGQNRMAEGYRANNVIYPETGTLRTHHVTTNVIIEPDGSNRARTQSYFTVLQSAPDFPL